MNSLIAGIFSVIAWTFVAVVALTDKNAPLMVQYLVLLALIFFIICLIFVLHDMEHKNNKTKEDTRDV